MAETVPTTARTRTAAEIEELLVRPRPTHRQLRWQSHELYAFVHFGINTMTDREWGSGDEDPAIFDPDELDADQWMTALAAAGMTGVILTAKHHDGFCLWPSRQTRHSVQSSPWRGGRGDVVGEVAAAARRHGLALGLYLSPWDRADARYGSGRAYDDYFVAQLSELLSDYGPVFSVWFDGACGEGPNGRTQSYDWDRYYATIRALQPDAAISVCGPDVRWCGNEAGHFRADEWSVVPRALQDVERIADTSQQIDDTAFARVVRSDQEDLGSRTAVAGQEDDLIWYPAEVNTSIRPGWFHHPNEDGQVRSVEELWAIYCGAVGGNATFLLNVPPDRRGLLAEPDVAALRGLGERVADLRRRQLSTTVDFSSGGWAAPDDQADGSAADWGRDHGVGVGADLGLANGTGWWAPADDDDTPTVTLRWSTPTWVDTVVCKEEITLGQRIEHLVVSGWSQGERVELAQTRSVGYQRMITFEPTLLEGVSVQVVAARGTPFLAGATVLSAPAEGTTQTS